MCNSVIIYLVLLCIVGSAYSMRCNNQLILEGDSLGHLISACGQPTTQFNSSLQYINKDLDGGNYYIHIGLDGLISDIRFSRGS